MSPCGRSETYNLDDLKHRLSERRCVMKFELLQLITRAGMGAVTGPDLFFLRPSRLIPVLIYRGLCKFENGRERGLLLS